MSSNAKQFVTKQWQLIQHECTQWLKAHLPQTQCRTLSPARQVASRPILRQTSPPVFSVGHDTFYQLICLQKEINQLMDLLQERSADAARYKSLRLERLALLEAQKFDLLWSNSHQNLQTLNHLTMAVSQAAAS